MGVDGLRQLVSDERQRIAELSATITDEGVRERLLGSALHALRDVEVAVLDPMEKDEPPAEALLRCGALITGWVAGVAKMREAVAAALTECGPDVRLVG